MVNVSDKGCKETQNTHFMFSAFFRKFNRLRNNVEKVVETEGTQMTSQSAAYALHPGLARLHSLTRMHTPTRTHAHSCTHRLISNTYCFSTATMIRESATMLPYTYIASRVCEEYNSMEHVAHLNIFKKFSSYRAENAPSPLKINKEIRLLITRITQHSPTREADNSSGGRQTESSFPCLQGLAIGPYPKPD